LKSVFQFEGHVFYARIVWKFTFLTLCDVHSLYEHT